MYIHCNIKLIFSRKILYAIAYFNKFTFKYFILSLIEVELLCYFHLINGIWNLKLKIKTILYIYRFNCFILIFNINYITGGGYKIIKINLNQVLHPLYP